MSEIVFGVLITQILILGFIFNAISKTDTSKKTNKEIANDFYK